MKLLIGQQMVMPALESVRLGKTRNEAAACLTATVLIAPADTYFLKLSVAVGDVVRLLDDGGKEIFLGSVHELDRTPETVTLTAYDRGVYLARNELYGVYAGGTMAHSWVQMFDSELDAFRAYCETYPDNATLLVDTYNSLQSGVPNAIRAFNEVLRPKGITHCGIRFDSGDIAYLTKKARKMLDDAGWPDCKITVSNALDERLIAGLLRQGAQVDSFGVGERLITARSEPVFGGVYKLAAIEDADGNIIPKIKISENVGKITNPHFKKVYRFYSKDSGMAEADYICLHDEVVDDTQPLEICDPDATWKKKVLTDFTARELQVPIFRGGKLVYQKPALDDIRAYCADQLTTLWPEVLRFDYPHNYYVDLSEKLLKIKLDLLNAGGKSQG